MDNQRMDNQGYIRRFETRMEEPLLRRRLRGAYFTGDHAAISLQTTITRDGAACCPDSAAGYAIRPDGVTVLLACTTERNTVRCTLPGDAAAIAGTTTVLLRALFGESLVTVLAVDLPVDSGTTGDMTDPADALPTLETLLARIADMETAAAQCRAATAAANQAAQERALALMMTTEAAPLCAFSPETDSVLRPELTLRFHRNGTGTPAPDNICRMDPVQTLHLMHRGVNLLDSLALTGPACARDGNTLRLTGTSAAAPVALPAGCSWCLRMAVSGVTELALRLTSAIGSVRSLSAQVQDGAAVWRFASQEDISMVSVSVPEGSTAVLSAIQLESGGTPTDAQPCAGSCETVTLPEACWGGVLDWASGVLTVTHGGIVLTGEEQSALVSNDYCYLYVGLPLEKKDGEGWCSHYPYRLWSTIAMRNGNIAYKLNGRSKDEWVAWVQAQYAAGTPVTLAYELATPVTVQLTGLPVLRGLSGVNHIATDGGDTAVTFHAELAEVVRSLTERLVRLEAK